MLEVTRPQEATNGQDKVFQVDKLKRILSSAFSN